MFNPKKFVDENKKKVVAIVMITFNRWELTEQSLNSIFKNSFMSYRLTVVDNGSWDGTVEKLKSLKRQGKIHKLILLPDNVGVARGKNYGLKANRRSDWLVCIDNDIEILSSHWLTYLCYISSFKDYGIVGANSEGFNLGRLATHNGVNVNRCPTLGGIYAMSRDTFEKVGYFREMSLYGIEDWEIGLRQWDGYRLKNCYVEPVKCRQLKEIDFKMKDGKSYEGWKLKMKGDTWNKFRGRGSRLTSITDGDIEKYIWRDGDEN